MVPETTLQAATVSTSPISFTGLESANLLPSQVSSTFLATNLQPTVVSTTQISSTTVDSHFAELDSSVALDGAGTNAATAAPTGTRATTGLGRTNMYEGVPFAEAPSDAVLHTTTAAIQSSEFHEGPISAITADSASEADIHTTVAIQSSEYHEVPIRATTADSAFEADIHTTLAIQSSEYHEVPIPAIAADSALQTALDTTSAMHNMYHGVPFIASAGNPSWQSTVQHTT